MGIVMERIIKFRQPLFDSNGDFVEFAFWGIDLNDGTGSFWIGPASDQKTIRLSQEFTGLQSVEGYPLYEGDYILYQFEGSPKCWIVGVITYLAPYWKIEIRASFMDKERTQPNKGTWINKFHQLRREQRFHIIGHLYNQPDRPSR